jgi:hypothetical protein
MIGSFLQSFFSEHAVAVGWITGAVDEVVGGSIDEFMALGAGT